MSVDPISETSEVWFFLIYCSLILFMLTPHVLVVCVYICACTGSSLYLEHSLSAWLRGAPITAQEQEQGRNSCKAQTEKVQALLQGAAHRQAENQEDSSAAPSSPTIQPSMRCREGLRANSRSKQGMIST